MDSFKLLAFLVLMIAEAHAGALGSRSQRTSWSTPYFAGTSTRTRSYGGMGGGMGFIMEGGMGGGTPRHGGMQSQPDIETRNTVKHVERGRNSENECVSPCDNKTNRLHAWGLGSSDPVDCSVTKWTSWSTPFFAGTATRTRSVLRTPKHGGKPCPPVMETNNTGTQMTTKQVADSVTDHFLFQSNVITRLNRKSTFGQRRDLLVILDSSGSIGNGNFLLAVQQIADLLGFMCPETKPFDNNIHKLAVIRYSSKATEIFDFNAYSSTQSTLSAVRRIKYSGGGTNTAEAFKLAKNMLIQAKGARLDDADVKQEVLILTDGRSNNAAQSIAAAHALKAEADVFGLVIGNFSNLGKDEILQYVSDPFQEHLFSLPSFKELTDLVNHVRLSVASHKCAPFDLNRAG